MIPDYKPTTFERRVLQVMLKFDPQQNRGLSPAHIASEVWVRKRTTPGRSGQNQAMGAQLQRMSRLGLVIRGDHVSGNMWFLTMTGREWAVAP